MERPGQVFSRVQVLDHVWGHGIFIEDRTVDVHFSRLRKALNHRQDGSDYPDLIRTARGSGYALKSLNKNDINIYTAILLKYSDFINFFTL